MKGFKIRKGGTKVKELGNLAVICAGRKDVMLMLYEGAALLFIGKPPDCKAFRADCSNEKKIEGLIHELNFGTLSERRIGNDNAH
jgi:hypothetical protein